MWRDSAADRTGRHLVRSGGPTAMIRKMHGMIFAASDSANRVRPARTLRIPELIVRVRFSSPDPRWKPARAQPSCRTAHCQARGPGPRLAQNPEASTPASARESPGACETRPGPPQARTARAATEAAARSPRNPGPDDRRSRGRPAHTCRYSRPRHGRPRCGLAGSAGAHRRRDRADRRAGMPRPPQPRRAATGHGDRGRCGAATAASLQATASTECDQARTVQIPELTARARFSYDEGRGYADVGMLMDVTACGQADILLKSPRRSGPPLDQRGSHRHADQCAPSRLASLLIVQLAILAFA